MLYLDFHHHTILVRSIESSLLQKLKDEFHFFIGPKTENVTATIELHLSTRPEIPKMVATKILENAIIYRLGSKQYVDYFGEALTIYDRDENKVDIFSQNESRLYELAFLSIHSILGQELDKSGFCRIHAVALSMAKVNAVVMLPSKGGKSTLLKHIIENPAIKIISDDMPLCSLGGDIYPFPSKLSLNEIPLEGPLSKLTWHEFKRHHYPVKYTASLAQLSDKLDPAPQDNKNLLIAGFRLSNGSSLLTEVPKWKMIKPLLEHMIMGFGLPQILEMFLSFSFKDIFKLIHHGFLRTVSAFNLLRKARCFHFYLGPDKTHNAHLLMDLLNEHKDS